MNTRAIVILSALNVAGLSGCTTTGGFFKEQSHFDYPNSNVKPLGAVKSTFSKGRFLIPYTPKKQDVIKLIDDALAHKPGSDILINYYINTSYTEYPFFIVTKMTLHGTAATMVVGEQNLVNESRYR